LTIEPVRRYHLVAMSEKSAPRTDMPVSLPQATRLAAETRALAEGRDLSGILTAALNLYLRTSPGEDPAPGNYGKGRLFLRGTTYWTAVWAPSPDGKWHEARETTRTDDERKARRILEDRIRRVKNHRDGIQTFQSAVAEKSTVNDILDALIADYELRKVKSIRHSISHLKPVRAFFGTRRALSVSPDLVRNYIEMRKAKGRSSAKVSMFRRYNVTSNGDQREAMRRQSEYLANQPPRQAMPDE